MLRAQKNGDTHKTNLGMFLGLVSSISDARAKNSISTERRAKELEKATKCDLLDEFIKADRSDWLAYLEEGKEDELDKVRNLFESNGSKISSHKKVGDEETQDKRSENIISTHSSDRRKRYQ